MCFSLPFHSVSFPFCHWFRPSTVRSRSLLLYGHVNVHSFVFWINGLVLPLIIEYEEFVIVFVCLFAGPVGCI